MAPRTLLAMTLVGLTCSGATLLGTLLAAPLTGRAASEAQAVVPLVRAERIELVDAAGRPRIVLQVLPTVDQPVLPTVAQPFDGIAALQILDETGTQRLALDAYRYGGSIGVGDGSDEHSVTISADNLTPPGAASVDVLTRPPSPGESQARSTWIPRAGVGARPGDGYGVYAGNDAGEIVWQAP